MPTYGLIGVNLSVCSQIGSHTDYLIPDFVKSPYASHLVEVCTDFRELVLHLSLPDGWEHTSVH